MKVVLLSRITNKSYVIHSFVYSSKSKDELASVLVDDGLEGRV